MGGGEREIGDGRDGGEGKVEDGSGEGEGWRGGEMEEVGVSGREGGSAAGGYPR